MLQNLRPVWAALISVTVAASTVIPGFWHDETEAETVVIKTGEIQLQLTGDDWPKLRDDYPVLMPGEQITGKQGFTAKLSGDNLAATITATLPATGQRVATILQILDASGIELARSTGDGLTPLTVCAPLPASSGNAPVVVSGQVAVTFADPPGPPRWAGTFDYNRPRIDPKHLAITINQTRSGDGFNNADDPCEQEGQ